MQRTANTPIQITRFSHKQAISGVVKSALSKGTLVNFKQSNSVDDPPELVVASGRYGFVLTEDIISLVDWNQYLINESLFPTNVKSKLPIGSVATGIAWEALEVEGADALDTTITVFAANAKLTTYGGKLALWDGDAETPTRPGDIIAHMELPKTPQVAGALRISVAAV